MKKERSPTIIIISLLIILFLTYVVSQELENGEKEDFKNCEHCECDWMDIERMKEKGILGNFSSRPKVKK